MKCLEQKKIKYVNHHLQIFDKIDTMPDIHRKLVLSFDIYNKNSITNSHNNITKKALKNIVCEISNGKAYFLPQLAGSCTYKSLLMAWIIYCILSPRYVPNIVYDLYVQYTNSFSLSIESIIKYYKLDKEGTCGSKIIEHMLEDNIIDISLIKKYDLYNFQEMLIFKKDEPIIIGILPNKITKSKINNIYDRSTLNQLIHEIRMKINDIPYHIQKLDAFWKLYSSDLTCMNNDSFQTEIFIMLLLINYYYRKSELNGIISDDEYINLKIDVPSGRIELLEHERAWISNILFASREMRKNLYNSVGLKKYFNIDLLLMFSFSNSEYRFFQDKMYFVNKYIIKNNDTVLIKKFLSTEISRISRIETTVSFDPSVLIIEFIKKK